MAEQISLAEYLFTRLRQVGVDSVHGVPGDYNLWALDFVGSAGLDWIGSCNELNAGYAADGYARVKGIGALVVTFGVGELSAMNAIAGAFAEQVPVILIAGSPTRENQNAKRFVHHTLGNGDFEVFARVAREFTVAQAILMDPEKAPGMIDNTIKECIQRSRPVHIQLPDDVAEENVPKSLLSTPIDLSFMENDQCREDVVVSKLLDRIYSARQPFILVDGGTSRYGIAEEVNRFVRETGFPTSTTPFGKGIQDETVPNFHGVYNGESGKLRYTSWVKGCDLILRFGPSDSNINTMGYTLIPPKDIRVDFFHHSIEMTGLAPQETENLYVKKLLAKLLTKLDPSKVHKYDPYPDLGTPQKLLDALPETDSKALIDQNTFFQRMSSFFRPGDVIMTETGTMSVGGRDFVLPPQTSMINSSTWLSIGYMLPASQGAAAALRDIATKHQIASPRRVILFQGDGSFQMTAQELSTIIRQKLDFTFFLVNNDGYVIERFLHGMQASYNDIAPWRYLEGPSFFGAPKDGSYNVHTFRATNWGDLNSVMKNDYFREGRGLKLVEVVMGREDCPESLKLVAKLNEEHRKARHGN